MLLFFYLSYSSFIVFSISILFLFLFAFVSKSIFLSITWKTFSDFHINRKWKCLRFQSENLFSVSWSLKSFVFTSYSVMCHKIHHINAAGQNFILNLKCNFFHFPHAWQNLIFPFPILFIFTQNENPTFMFETVISDKMSDEAKNVLTMTEKLEFGKANEKNHRNCF